MALSDYKITEAQINQNGVISAPDILTGTADENKKVFDKLIRQIVATAVNNLIDALSSSDAASEIPISNIDGLDAQTVQQAIAEIYQGLNDYMSLIAGNEGASQVGVSTIDGVSGSNVQQALQSIKGLIDSIEAGVLLPGSVTAEMIQSGAIVELGALLAVSAAAAYNPSVTYAVGDYCTNDGNLYKCNTPINGGEAWNAAHWTMTTVAAELAGRLSRSGGLMSGAINWGNNRSVSGGSTETELDFAAGKASIRLIPQNAVGNDISKCVAIRDTGNGNLYYIATATPPQEVPLPLVSGVSELNVATAEKTQEGIVLVNAWVGFDSPVIANTETQVAIMPENMRPKKTVGVTALVDSGADKNLGFARISIDSGGVVRILSDISFSFAVFSIAYPAAN